MVDILLVMHAMFGELILFFHSWYISGYSAKEQWATETVNIKLWVIGDRDISLVKCNSQGTLINSGTQSYI